MYWDFQSQGQNIQHDSCKLKEDRFIWTQFQWIHSMDSRRNIMIERHEVEKLLISQKQAEKRKNQGGKPSSQVLCSVPSDFCLPTRPTSSSTQHWVNSWMNSVVGKVSCDPTAFPKPHLRAWNLAEDFETEAITRHILVT